MSTAQSCRYLLAAGAAFVGVGVWMDGAVLTGVFFLITAVLLLPILYQLLYIKSNEVQFLSPIVFLVVAVFSFAMYIGMPDPYTIPPKVVYSDSVSQSTTSATITYDATTITFTTTQTSVVITQTSATSAATQVVEDAVSVVYRTPSGKRYHYNAECGGENSYEISFEEALSSGLTPCKKCADG